jgi:hypothetical protein
MAFCADAVPVMTDVAPHRRRHPRYTLRSLAYVKLDQGNGGIVRDLTESGAAIQSVAPMRAGQEVTLRFDLLSPRVRVEARGHVAWANASGASGIQFEPLPARMRSAIRDWLLLQMLSAASVSGRDTIFASSDTQFMFSPEPGHPAIVMDTPASEATFEEGRLRWGLLSFSINSFPVVLDSLVLLCAVLLFSTSSLAIMGGMPAWPLAAALLITSSTIFVAVYSLLFSDFLCGATPGRRLAVMAASSNFESEPAPRFR